VGDLVLDVGDLEGDLQMLRVEVPSLRAGDNGSDARATAELSEDFFEGRVLNDGLIKLSSD